MNKILENWPLILVVIIAIVLVIATHPKPNRRVYWPHLIDLPKYKRDLQQQARANLPLTPPTPIPGVEGRKWSADEMEAMRQNRKQANEIYLTYKAHF